jgi:2-aminobenzoate-CoA ligase
VALPRFTFGTSGRPKATMHFRCDLLIIADGYAREALQVTPDAVFVGSPLIALNFGLSGLASFCSASEPRRCWNTPHRST